MFDKKSVFLALQTEVNARIESLEMALDESRSEMVSESKSTAGDKHETGRAMAQLEQEKLGGQVLNARELKQVIAQIDPTVKNDSVTFGSLVKTSTGWFFFSVGIGKLLVQSETVFCLTITSPLGNAMQGKKSGEHFQLNGNTLSILEVS